jgi:hypothetical protein
MPIDDNVVNHQKLMVVLFKALTLDLGCPYTALDGRTAMNVRLTEICRCANASKDGEVRVSHERLTV